MSAINIGGVEFTQEQVTEMAQKGLLSIGQKHDPASLTLTATPLHGRFHGNTSQYGVFANPGGRPDVLSFAPRVRSLSNVLSMRPANNINEYQDVKTGVTAGAGTNATGWCGNPPSAGQFKTSRLSFVFGAHYEKTQLNAIPEIGMVLNRADQPRRVVNLQGGSSRFIPSLAQALPDTLSQLANELITFGFDVERNFEQVMFTGNSGTASASARRGFIKEFDGFDQYIKTSYSASAVNSVVKTFNTIVTGTTSAGLNIVQTLANALRGLRSRANSWGIDANWYLAMREDLFWSLVEVYATAYYTRSMTGSSSLPIVQSGRELTDFRDRIIAQQSLPIDGMNVPVVFTDGIPRENTANGRYKSDIYIIPVESNVGDLTYIEYNDMGSAPKQEFLSLMSANGGGQIATMNDGFYLVGNRSTPFCWEYHFASQMRLIVSAPPLCGRVDDVQYDFDADIRDAIPGESFYANGGSTYWNGQFAG